MKITKALGISLIAAISLSAQSVTVNGGWSLLGAVEDIQPHQVSCAKTAWVYDNGSNSWMLYTRQNMGDGLDTPENYGYTSITNIAQGKGFWVNADSSGCTIDFSNTSGSASSTFNMFGFNWEDVKKDDRYTVSGNSVTQSTDMVTLTSNKNSGDKSRTEMASSLSSSTDVISADLEISTTSTGYNRVELRAHTNVTISEATRSEYGFNSNNVRAYIVLGMKSRSVFAYVYLDDGTTESKVWDTKDSSGNSTMYYNDVSSVVIGKTLNVKIKTDGSNVVFSATDTSTSAPIMISDATFNLAGMTISDFDTIKVRTQIDDSTNAAGDTITANVYDVTDEDVVTTDVATLSWNSVTSAISVEEEYDHEYMKYTKGTATSGTFSTSEYEYYDGTWSEEEDSPISVNYTVNSDNNMSISETGGFAADLVITKTEQINSIDGVTYTDLFVSDVELTVTTPESWTDTWDWDAGSSNVTTNSDLLSSFLASSNPMWTGGDNNPITLTGSGTSGDVVRGNCVSYNSYGCSNMTRVESDVVGNWTYSDANGITITTDTEIETLSIINTESGYKVQSVGQDQVGAVFYEELFTGSDATEANIRALLVD